jgi:hypothetical protein
VARGGRPPGGGGKPARGAAPGRLKQTRRPAKRPQRRRRGLIARAGQRGVALTVLSITAVAIAAVAIAGALTSSNTSGTTQAAATSPSKPAPTASKSSGPLGPTLPGLPTSHPSPHISHAPSLSPTPAPVTTKPAPHTASPSAAAVASPKPTPSESATSNCASPTDRVAEARRLLQHQSALPSNVALQIEGARQGLLGSSDAQARTLTLYVRSCSDEPTLELAVVWGYEAGQFIRTEAWSSATRARWNQLRGSSFVSSDQFKQDAASVYAFWQTGSTSYWQSPIAPPSYGQLSQLAPYLKTS